MIENTTNSDAETDLFLFSWEGPARHAPGVLLEVPDDRLPADVAMADLVGWVAVTALSGPEWDSDREAIRAKASRVLTAWSRENGRSKLNELKQLVTVQMMKHRPNGKLTEIQLQQRIDDFFNPLITTSRTDEIMAAIAAHAAESVESLLDRWQREFRHASFTYADPDASFRQHVAEHFGDANERVDGVYLIRRRCDRAILYIGKGGTIGGDGQLKGQDLRGRLRNVRGDIGADRWFRELLLEAGPLDIEYVVLALPFAPAYLEVSLLQAYLGEYGRLPPKNSAL